MNAPLHLVARSTGEQAQDPIATQRVLDGLIRMNQAATRARGIVELLEESLEVLQKVTGTERSAVLLVDDGGVMRFRAWRGISDEYRAAVEGHSPWAPDAAEPEPVLVPDVHQDPALTSLGPLFTRESIGAVAFVPLVSGGKLLGKFMLYYGAPHAFTAEELSLAQVIASHVAFVVGRKRIEEELERLHRELNDAVTARDEFLSIAAHELKTPLTGLLLQLDACSPSGGRAPTGELLERRLKTARRQVRRINGLVDELLEVSRISAGRLLLDPEPVDMIALVDEVAQRMLPDLERAGCRLNVDATESLVGAFDRLRLELVVENLLSNALKYGSGRPVHVSLRHEESAAVLRVRDEGIGIPADKLTRVFDRFERMVSTRHFGGFGLGLWIVRQVVEAHGGTVSVESVEGRGATFTVRLPLSTSLHTPTA